MTADRPIPAPLIVPVGTVSLADDSVDPYSDPDLIYGFGRMPEPRREAPNART
jgi:hypothetical protein